MGTTLAALLVADELGQLDQLLAHPLDEIVVGEDPLQGPLLVDHGEAPHTSRAHALERFVDVVRLAREEEILPHDLAQREILGALGRGGDEEEEEIAVGHDADRMHAVVVILHDDQAAHVQVPHAPAGIEDMLVAARHRHRARAELSDVHPVLQALGAVPDATP